MTISVLVADDQAPFRRAVRALLDSTSGFRVIGEADSGEEVLSMVESLLPQVVLIDVSMAGIGGIEAARRLAASHPEMLTVLLSTYREEDLRVDVRARGAAPYVHKSDFSIELLAELWTRLD